MRVVISFIGKNTNFALGQTKVGCSVTRILCRRHVCWSFWLFWGFIKFSRATRKYIYKIVSILFKVCSAYIAMEATSYITRSSRTCMLTMGGDCWHLIMWFLLQSTMAMGGWIKWVKIRKWWDNRMAHGTTDWLMEYDI